MTVDEAVLLARLVRPSLPSTGAHVDDARRSAFAPLAVAKQCFARASLAHNAVLVTHSGWLAVQHEDGVLLRIQNVLPSDNGRGGGASHRSPIRPKPARMMCVTGWQLTSTVTPSTSRMRQRHCPGQFTGAAAGPCSAPRARAPAVLPDGHTRPSGVSRLGLSVPLFTQPANPLGRPGSTACATLSA